MVVETRPTREQLFVVEKALHAISIQGARPLYARVDLIPGDDDEPALLELELIEPNLFLAYSPKSLENFAATILTWSSLESQKAT